MKTYYYIDHKIFHFYFQFKKQNFRQNFTGYGNYKYNI